MTTRRGLFGLVAGAIAAPYLKPAPIPYAIGGYVGPAPHLVGEVPSEQVFTVEQIARIFRVPAHLVRPISWPPRISLLGSQTAPPAGPGGVQTCIKMHNGKLLN